MRSIVVTLIAVAFIGCGAHTILPGVTLRLEKPALIGLEVDVCEAYNKLANVGGKVGDGLEMVNVKICDKPVSVPVEVVN